MRKLASAVIVIMFMALYSNFSFAAPNIVEKPLARLIVNSKSTVLKDKPVLIGQKLYLKVKALAVNIGIKDDKKGIVINNAKKQYTLVRGNSKVILKLNDKRAVMNGKVITLDSSPVLYKNNVYLPADTVARLFQEKVVWDEASGTIAICSDASFKLVKDIMGKSDKVMASVKYKGATTVSINIDNTVKRTEKFSTQTDPQAKINHKITLIEQNGVTDEEEDYTTEKYDYTKSSISGIWTKTASEGYNADVIGTEGENNDFIYAGLATNIKSADAIILEGDIEIHTLFGDVINDSTYMAHTKITLDKKNYYVKEIKWSSSGVTVINDSKYKYIHNTTFMYTDFNGDFEVKIPEELVQLKETKIYNNSDLGMALNYPSDWDIKENVSGVNAAFISAKENSSDDFSENVVLVVQNLSEQPMTLEEYTELSFDQLQKLLSEYKLISSEESLLGGLKAQKIVYTYKQGLYNLKTMQVWTINGNIAYCLTFTSILEKYDSYINTAEDIVKSFVIE